MTAYYNEFDPKAAVWLRTLIKWGLIAPGVVDERSIEDVRPDELTGYTQCHFFAGIGGWSLALRRAGWPDDRPVWTGSCPCQPFSAAGAGRGTDDERHLWPAFRWLIDQCRPSVVFGEQVASKAGRHWLSDVRADLEALGYGVGAADLCAAGAGEKAKGRIDYENNSFEWKPIVLGAPHIRQRLFWVADTDGGKRDRIATSEGCVANGTSARWKQSNCGVAGDSQTSGLADAVRTGRAARGSEPRNGQIAWSGGDSGTTSSDQQWGDVDWLFCQDGKWRPVEPGTFPLAHGLPARMGRLRGYGNAINIQTAQIFIEGYMGCSN